MKSALQRTKQKSQMVDPEKTILNFISSDALHPELLSDLFNQKTTAPCFLLGRNPLAQTLLKHINIDGWVDDYFNGQTWSGKRVLKSKDIPEGSIVINCSVSISPLSANKQLSRQKEVTVIPYSDIMKANQDQTLIPEFVKESRQDYLDNKTKLQAVFERFQDDESRNTFNKLLSYRLTCDISYMEGFSVRFNEQYFEPFLGSFEAACFADCGGFDGDTTEEFIKRYPYYSKVYLFEPSEENLQKAKRRLSQNRNIEFIPLGVSDKTGSLSFDSQSGSACSVSPDGLSTIEVTTLDEFISNPLSFIKMDLEGWELNALAGAYHHIQNHNPILAIAVYHFSSDFWKIPEYILNINPGYKIYLRHYTEGWSETVMYFVPD